MTVHTSLVGASDAAPHGDPFHATEAATGAPLADAYHAATAGDVDRAAGLAAEAAGPFGRSTGAARGALLRRVADALDADVDALVALASRETGLPEGRLRGETGRTTGQLRLFAALAEDGSWVDARLDTPDPARAPAPRPDVRSMLRPLGPVAVFGASNFPLAFSVAGGDTASALAAGCPVVVKAHPAHLGTSVRVGRLVREAVAAEGLPEGVFSLLLDAGVEAGVALVRHPAVRAVGFTGSRRGGLALAREAAARAVPVPVYAEMGSVNPFVVLPGALAARAAEIAAQLAGSVALGAGQFCTQPGLAFVPAGAAGDALVATLADALRAAPAATMLTPTLADAYAAGVDGQAGTPGVRVRLRAPGAGAAAPGAAVLDVSADAFRAHPHLADEVFGPSTLAVRYPDLDVLAGLLRGLDGQLTATVHATDAELDAAHDVLGVLEDRVGRVLFGGVPTGVEVGPAMVHGGPFPATTDSRTTSVGTRAVERWARAVCWQDAPQAVLPPALRDGNPLGLRRLVDGRPEA